jgi:hypothetical protein
MILASCALHNYIKRSDEQKPVRFRHYMLEGEELENSQWPFDEEIDHGGNRSSLNALNIRNLFAKYFSTVGSVPWQHDVAINGYKK